MVCGAVAGGGAGVPRGSAVVVAGAVDGLLMATVSVSDLGEDLGHWKVE